MKYILLVSHGTMAQGVHSVLDMLVGEGREDILSTSLKNGMGADELAENVRKCVSVVKEEDELLVFADLIGGSPLTTTANVLAEEGLLNRTTMVGGMNLPLVVSALYQKTVWRARFLLICWFRRRGKRFGSLRWQPAKGRTKSERFESVKEEKI